MTDVFGLCCQQVTVPFEMGVHLSEAEYEEYGMVLQKILQEVLGDDPPAGNLIWPLALCFCQNIAKTTTGYNPSVDEFFWMLNVE